MSVFVGSVERSKDTSTNPVVDFVSSVKKGTHKYNRKKKLLRQHPEDWVDNINEYNKMHIDRLKIRLNNLQAHRLSEWSSRTKATLRIDTDSEIQDIESHVIKAAKEMFEAEYKGYFTDGSITDSPYNNIIKEVEYVLQEYTDRFPEHFI